MGGMGEVGGMGRGGGEEGRGGRRGARWLEIKPSVLQVHGYYRLINESIISMVQHFTLT